MSLYLVILTIDREPSYGVDSSSYGIGIYESLDDAEKAINSTKLELLSRYDNDVEMGDEDGNESNVIYTNDGTYDLFIQEFTPNKTYSFGREEENRAPYLGGGYYLE